MQKNILWYETNFIDVRNKWHKLDVLLKNKEHNTKILDMLGKNDIIAAEFSACVIF